MGLQGVCDTMQDVGIVKQLPPPHGLINAATTLQHSDRSMDLVSPGCHLGTRSQSTPCKQLIAVSSDGSRFPAVSLSLMEAITTHLQIMCVGSGACALPQTPLAIKLYTKLATVTRESIVGGTLLCIPACMSWPCLGKAIAWSHGTHRPVGPLVLLDVAVATRSLQDMPQTLLRHYEGGCGSSVWNCLGMRRAHGSADVPASIRG